MKLYFKLNDPTDVSKGYTELTKSELFAYKKPGKHFFINLDYAYVETSEMEYHDFYKDVERDKYQDKQAEKYDVMSYHNLHGVDGEGYGEELLKDESVDVEKTAIGAIFSEQMMPKLQQALDMLSPKEINLINRLFIDGLSEYELSKELGIPRTTIIRKKQQILKDLRLHLKRM